MSARKHNIPSLDGLRAISIGLVLFSHLLGTKHFPLGYNAILANCGSLGVRVFFVISGFLITGLLLRERETTGTINLKEFYFRRTLRIFPVYYFYLLVIAVLTVAGYFVIPWKEFLPPLTYTTDFFHMREWLLGHSWSLSIEEQFYLLWPGLLVLFGISRGMWLLVITVALMPFGRLVAYHFNPSPDNHALSYGVVGNLDSIATGCLLAMTRGGLHANRFYSRMLSCGIVAVLPFILFLANSTNNHPNVYYFLAVPVCNICIAICLDWSITYPASRVGRVLNSRPFVAIGLISYSLYLWQQPFLTPKNHDALAFPVNVLCAIAAAVASYFLIEKPALRLRSYLDRRWFGRNKGMSPSVRADVTASTGDRSR